MISDLLSLLVMAVAVEAISEIVTSSELFRPLHKNIFDRAYPNPPVETVNTQLYVWLFKLINCGYCISVWISAILVLINGAPKSIGYLVAVFVIHRISNWIHVVYELVRKGRVNSISLSLEETYGTAREGVAEGTTEAQS